VDLILTEGYKKDVQPKIEVFREGEHNELLCTKEDNLIGIVSNKTFDIGVSCFFLDDMKGLADYIERRFLKSERKGEISLQVDGKGITLTPFVKRILTKTIKGMLSALKGCETPEYIQIRIEGEEKQNKDSPF
jgi:hypothetical protein